MSRLALLLFAVSLLVPVHGYVEDPPARAEAAAPAAAQAEPDRAELHAKFIEMMTNVKFVGQFTVAGKQQENLPKEEYEIRGVTKMPQGDYWLISSRIKYGDHDVTVPIPLEVKWAGDTPVITLTDLTIPGLGTFSARVVLHEGKYAGTWRHGEVGGHLFGTLEKSTEPPSEAGEEKANGENP